MVRRTKVARFKRSSQSRENKKAHVGKTDLRAAMVREYGLVSEGTLRYILDALTWMRGDVFSKADYVIREIPARHPLVNGNKKLAWPQCRELLVEKCRARN